MRASAGDVGSEHEALNPGLSPAVPEREPWSVSLWMSNTVLWRAVCNEVLLLIHLEYERVVDDNVCLLGGQVVIELDGSLDEVEYPLSEQREDTRHRVGGEEVRKVRG